MTLLHITPAPTPTLTRWHVCPCCDAEAHIVGATQDWYDTVWTCCRCGDSWAGGELMPRPFMRGWRARSIRHARQDWYDVVAGAEVRP